MPQHSNAPSALRDCIAEEVRGERRVVVTLAKATRGLWRSVIQGDPQLDLAALATLSGYNDRKQAGGSHRLQCFEE